MGAEDYIVKPFEVIELLARVDVVLRRYKRQRKSLRSAACGSIPAPCGYRGTGKILR